MTTPSVPACSPIRHCSNVSLNGSNLGKFDQDDGQSMDVQPVYKEPRVTEGILLWTQCILHTECPENRVYNHQNALCDGNGQTSEPK